MKKSKFDNLLNRIRIAGKLCSQMCCLDMLTDMRSLEEKLCLALKECKMNSQLKRKSIFGILGRMRSRLYYSKANNCLDRGSGRLS